MTFSQLAVCPFRHHNVAGAQDFVITNHAADPAIFAVQRLYGGTGNTLRTFGFGLTHKPRIEAGAQ